MEKTIISAALASAANASVAALAPVAFPSLLSAVEVSALDQAALDQHVATVSQAIEGFAASRDCTVNKLSQLVGQLFYAASVMHPATDTIINPTPADVDAFVIARKQRKESQHAATTFIKTNLPKAYWEDTGRKYYGPFCRAWAYGEQASVIDKGAAMLASEFTRSHVPMTADEKVAAAKLAERIATETPAQKKLRLAESAVSKAHDAITSEQEQAYEAAQAAEDARITHEAIEAKLAESVAKDETIATLRAELHEARSVISKLKAYFARSNPGFEVSSVIEADDVIADAGVYVPVNVADAVSKLQAAFH